MAVRVWSMGQSLPKSNRIIWQPANLTRSTLATLISAWKYMTPLTSVPQGTVPASSALRLIQAVSLVLTLTTAISCSLSR